MMNIVRITNSDYIEVEYEINYLGDRINRSNILEAIENLGKDTEFENELFSNEEVFQYMKDCYDLECESIKELEYEVTSTDIIYELIGYNSDALLTEILKKIGLQFGTVGYSPWSYYIAIEGIDSTYIRDLYEGYNFYDIMVIDEEGEILDSCCQFYLPTQTKEEIDSIVKEHFGIVDEYYMVENSDTQYFDKNIKRIKEVKHVSYSYKLEEDN